MAVTYVEQKDNLLGGLGALADLGGTVTGAGWLNILGSGLGKLDNLVNNEYVNGKDNTGALSEIFKGLSGAGKTLWKTLSNKNIGKVNTNEQNDATTYIDPMNFGSFLYGYPYAGVGGWTWQQ